MTRQKPSAKARRSAARLSAVQALYQSELIGTPVEQVIGEFVNFRFGAIIDGEEFVSPDPQLFADVTRGAHHRRADLDPVTSSAIDEHWSRDRMELLLQVILRAGTWELVDNPSVPSGIIITEYVNVAHAFFGGKEPAMVNAVLDRIARSVRPEVETPRADEGSMA